MKKSELRKMIKEELQKEEVQEPSLSKSITYNDALKHIEKTLKEKDMPAFMAIFEDLWNLDKKEMISKILISKDAAKNGKVLKALYNAFR